MKWILPALLVGLLAACSKPAPEAAAPAHAAIEPKAPHGGTAVEIGDYHLEFVLTPERGLLEAYVLDDDLENFVRIQATSFEVTATAAGTTETLTFTAGGDLATGEVVGNTSYFTATSPWLRTHPLFSGTLLHLTIKGSDFDRVSFKFP